MHKFLSLAIILFLKHFNCNIPLCNILYTLNSFYCILDCLVRPAKMNNQINISFLVLSVKFPKDKRQVKNHSFKTFATQRIAQSLRRTLQLAPCICPLLIPKELLCCLLFEVQANQSPVVHRSTSQDLKNLNGIVVEINIGIIKATKLCMGEIFLCFLKVVRNIIKIFVIYLNVFLLLLCCFFFMTACVW